MVEVQRTEGHRGGVQGAVVREGPRRGHLSWVLKEKVRRKNEDTGPCTVNPGAQERPGWKEAAEERPGALPEPVHGWGTKHGDGW